jgi:hypothetical protein|tara:strand:+ start:7430 stop:7789 length:360 start_codon:yes stop_codon:yes gene_type:complete
MKEFKSGGGFPPRDSGRFKDVSKKRLLSNINKKFNTTIIGSLAAFEELFGDLWGHGLEYQDLDEDQKYWRDHWLDVRTQILDAGNSNSRAAQSEIAEYSLSWNKYVTNFVVVNKENEEN